MDYPAGLKRSTSTWEKSVKKAKSFRISKEEDEKVIMVMDIDPAAARDKTLNPYNDVLNDRRPNIYRPLSP